MSLTSYRAAPPRVRGRGQSAVGNGQREERVRRLPIAYCRLPSALLRRTDGCEEEANVLGRPGDDLLSRVLRQSTIGAEAFDGRVRDGIGSDRLAEGHQAGEERWLKQNWIFLDERGRIVLVCRALATRAIKPNERLVPVSCTHCCASTPGLSTWSSSTALQGELVLRLVSRLDAFSGYPFHI